MHEAEAAGGEDPVKRKVAVLRPSNAPPVAKYFAALPPELGGGGGEELPPAHLVILEEDGGVASLSRYSRRGGFAGDTWHGSVAEALEQAQREFGGRIDEWRDVPTDADDPVLYGLSISEEN